MSDEGSRRAASEGGSRRTTESEKTTEQRTKEATKKAIKRMRERLKAHLESKSECENENFFITKIGGTTVNECTEWE